MTNHGQVDMTIKLEEYIYVIEIKMQQKDTASSCTVTPNRTLKQIHEQGYSDKYHDEPKKVMFEVGLIFSAETRNLVQADWLEI